MTLIELMVSIAISMLFTIIIFTLFSSNEERNRRVTGMSDASQNLTLTLGLLNNQIASAGNGLVGADTELSDSTQSLFPIFGCNVVTAATPAAIATPFRFAPVNATDGGAGAPDTLTVMYSGSGLGGAAGNAVTLVANVQLVAGAVLTLNSIASFSVTDWVLVADRSAASAALAAGAPCHIAQVAAVTKNTATTTAPLGGSAKGGTITLNNDLSANLTLAPNNYVVYNMGRTPRLLRYSLNQVAASGLPANTLIVTDLFSPIVAGGVNPSVVADQITNFQVQVGLDTAGTKPITTEVASSAILVSPGPGGITPPTQIPDDAVDVWQNPPAFIPTPAGTVIATAPFATLPAVRFSQIKALRVGLTARSSNPDRSTPPNTNTCPAAIAPTDPLPVGGGAPVAFIASGVVINPAAPLGTCWRYQSQNTVILLRNMIWGAF